MAAADESLPLGDPVPGWTPVERPRRAPMRGRHVLLRPLDAAADAPSLYAASHPPAGDAATWTYLPYGPYGTPGDLQQELEAFEASDDPLFFTAVTERGPSGIVSYPRITPEHGAIEVGHIWFGAGLRRTPAATEAIYLLARHAFD